MKKGIFKKIITLSLISLFSLQLFYIALEASRAEAVTDGVVVTLTVDAGITISDGAPVTMAPNIGISANSSIGGSSWTVITNDPDGYTLAVHASASPALVSGGNSFADYTETTTDVPELWNVTSGNKEFGYAVYGSDTNTTTWGTGSSCGSAGVPDLVNKKYTSTNTSPFTVVTRNSVTPVAGVATGICFAAEQDTVFAAAGVYTATITGTALVI